ncbi:hypothetical protein IJG72_02235 [bacterium]|nr:hypothetical protein [bacterium]
MKIFFRKNIYSICLGIVIFIGILLRLKGFVTNPSLWHDECALGWNILNKNGIELFYEKLRFLQVAPPLFLLFTKFFVWLFHAKSNVFLCDFTLRFLPFIFGNLSVIIFYFVCKSLYNSKWTTLVAVFLFCLNPVLINYTFEFKPYIIDVFAALSVLWIFLNINIKDIKLKKLLIYSGVLAFLPWFSFTSVIVEFAGFLMLSYKKENPKNFFILFSPTVLSIFIYIKTFIIRTYVQNSEGMLDYWQNVFVNKDLSNITQLNLQNLHYFFANLPFFSCTLFSLLLITGAFLFFKDYKLRFLLMSILVEATLIIMSIMKIYPYSTRLLIFLIPFLIIFGVKIFDIKNKAFASILILFIVIPHILFLLKFMQLKTVDKGYFPREMIINMHNNINPNDIIIINKSSNVEFLYYNTFFDFKNKWEITSIKDFLNKSDNLSNVTCWFYMPFLESKSIQNELFQWLNINSNIEFKLQQKYSLLLKTKIKY